MENVPAQNVSEVSLEVLREAVSPQPVVVADGF